MDTWGAKKPFEQLKLFIPNKKVSHFISSLYLSKFYNKQTLEIKILNKWGWANKSLQWIFKEQKWHVWTIVENFWTAGCEQLIDWNELLGYLLQVWNQKTKKRKEMKGK